MTTAFSEPESPSLIVTSPTEMVGGPSSSVIVPTARSSEIVAFVGVESSR